jgi:hypothetical protein
MLGGRTTAEKLGFAWVLDRLDEAPPIDTDAVREVVIEQAIAVSKEPLTEAQRMRCIRVMRRARPARKQ